MSLILSFFLKTSFNTTYISGASGVVKKGLWLKSTVVAVKALKNLPEFTDNAELISFYQEIATLRLKFESFRLFFDQIKQRLTIF